LKKINKQIYDRSTSWLDQCGRGTGFMCPNLQYQLKHFSLIDYARIPELLGYGNDHLEIGKMKIKEANLFNTVGCCI
jgi:hypothetical protein